MCRFLHTWLSFLQFQVSSENRRFLCIFLHLSVLILILLLLFSFFMFSVCASSWIWLSCGVGSRLVWIFFFYFFFFFFELRVRFYRLMMIFPIILADFSEILLSMIWLLHTLKAYFTWFGQICSNVLFCFLIDDSFLCSRTYSFFSGWWIFDMAEFFVFC